jgi:hypothetical protein
MNDGVSRYLRIYDVTGAWIDHPDFMILAALSQSQPASVEQIYASMVKEEKLNPPTTDGLLTDFAIVVKKKLIEKEVKQRAIAGEVVVELARLAAATGKPPSVNAARRLVAFNHHRHFRTSEPGSIEREVQRSFSAFRDTSHLQAAVVMEPSLVSELEGDMAKCCEFLGIARAFEDFIDHNVVSKAFEWSPLRIPTSIETLEHISFPPLSDQELAAAQLT